MTWLRFQFPHKFGETADRESVSSDMVTQWCNACGGITEWERRSTQTLEGRAKRDTMNDGRWHSKEETGGYWCSVCGNRPYTAKKQEPGRQAEPWETPTEPAFADMVAQQEQGKHRNKGLPQEH